MAQLKRPFWTEEQLRDGAQTATQNFREERMQEPLEQYLEVFDEYRSTVENLIEESVDLSKLSDQAVEYLTDANMLTAVRYLASPAISEDDLKVVAEAVLSPGRLRSNPEMARRVIDTVLLALDRNRFPWISEDREPSEAERETAIVSTTALIATQRVQTMRRTASKDGQEQAVKDRLLAEGFTEISTRVINNYSNVPALGEFCAESMFATRKADVVVRLWDGRTMPLECKVSNSSTNSVKRLNNDAAVKAKTWIHEFGTQNVVPAAVLSGVFKVHNLVTAQADGLSIFWAHEMDNLSAFIESTRTP